MILVIENKHRNVKKLYEMESFNKKTPMNPSFFLYFKIN